MKKLAFIGIYILLLVITGLLCQIAYNQYVENGGHDVLGISNLKKEEEAYFKRMMTPLRSGEVIGLGRYKIENLTLANRDVSEFFKKDIPFDKPNMPETYMLTWATLAVIDTMTFSFNDNKKRLSMASRYFTDDGWKSFTAGLKRSRAVEKIEVQEMMITAAPKGAPVINSRGVKNGRFQMVIELPLVLNYLSGAKSISQNMLVSVVIVRSDEEKHPYGVAIKQWIAVTN